MRIKKLREVSLFGGSKSKIPTPLVEHNHMKMILKLQDSDRIGQGNLLTHALNKEIHQQKKSVQ